MDTCSFRPLDKWLVRSASARVNMGRASCVSVLSLVTVLFDCLQNDVAALLKPISEKIQEIQTFRERNRGSKMFNHLSAVSESIPALGWIAVVSPDGMLPLHLVTCLECLELRVPSGSFVLRLLHWSGWMRQLFLALFEVQCLVFWGVGSVSSTFTGQSLLPTFKLTSPLLFFSFNAFSFLSFFFFPFYAWVMVLFSQSPKPGPYVKEMNDAATFYTNRVLKDYKHRYVPSFTDRIFLWSLLRHLSQNII